MKLLEIKKDEFINLDFYSIVIIEEHISNPVIDESGNFKKELSQVDGYKVVFYTPTNAYRESLIFNRYEEARLWLLKKTLASEFMLNA
jgi:hypothetical protein